MDPQPEHMNIMFDPTYALPIFGYVVPPLAVMILITNVPMIWTLNKRNMRSPVNTVLVCIAVSDTLAIMLPVVPFVYFYTLGYYEDFIPFSWCRAFFTLVHVLPLLCNMASLWSTVVLSMIHCYSVWRPLHVKSTVTAFRTNAIIFVIYVFSILVYLPTMFEYTYIPLSAKSMMGPNSTILSCHMQKSQSHLMDSFCHAHTWVQIICTSLLPWLLITFPDVGMLWKLRRAENERTALSGNAALNGNTNAAEKSVLLRIKLASQRRMTTWLIVLVASMVWLVEIPFAISFTKYMSHSSGDVMHNRLGDNVVFVFLLKYTTYPIIFVIYCFMSQRFRNAFRELFCTKHAAFLQIPSHKTVSTSLRDRSMEVTNSSPAPLRKPSVVSVE